MDDNTFIQLTSADSRRPLWVDPQSIVGFTERFRGALSTFGTLVYTLGPTLEVLETPDEVQAVLKAFEAARQAMWDALDTQADDEDEGEPWKR